MKNYTLPTIFFAVLFSVQSLFASSGQLESVSEEVLANNVFTKLDAKSLGAVTQTCNRFKNIVRDSPTLWKNRKVSLTKKNYPEILKAPYGFTVIHNCCPLVDYGFLDLEQLAEILTKYQSSIKDFYIGYTPRIDQAGSQALVQAITACRQLSTLGLKLRSWSPDGKYYLTKVCESAAALTTLRVDINDAYSSREFKEKDLINIPQIVIDNAPLTLRSLELGDCNSTREGGVYQPVMPPNFGRLAQFTSLENLKLHNFGVESLLTELAAHLPPSLTALDFTACDIFGETCIAAFQTNAPRLVNLKNLTITECQEGKHHIFIGFFKGVPDLEVKTVKKYRSPFQ